MDTNSPIVGLASISQKISTGALLVQIEGEADFGGDLGRRQISDMNSPVENAIGLLNDLLHSMFPGRQEIEAVRDQLLTAKDLRSPVAADHWLAKRNDLSPQVCRRSPHQ